MASLIPRVRRRAASPPTLAVGLLLVVVLVQPAGAREPAAYSVDMATLDAALDCDGDITGAGRSEPVLLVHGTGVTPHYNWSWNYRPALKAAGFEVCWISLPHTAYGDIQVSAEYVARAVERMSGRSGGRVDVIGHSQGGLVPRWAIKYFGADRYIDDYVALAAPNRGTLVADLRALRGRCSEACWQMRMVSRFVQVLNEGDQTPGEVSYTSIYTIYDDAIRPAVSAALEGASNVAVQQLCPDRQVSHINIVSDNVTYRVVVDALVNEGPADPDRISPLVCLTGRFPGVTIPLPLGGLPPYSDEVESGSEPPLKPYARP